MRATGIIMAGGKNSRMGAEKAHLQVGSETIMENTLEQLNQVVDDIIIVTNRPEVFSRLGLNTVADIYPGCGPLGGIHAGLHHSTTSSNLVVACDMPFLQPSILKYLLQYSENYDVVIPRVGQYLEPLTACYNKSCLEVIEDHLREGRFKTTSIFSKLNVMYVDREKLVELVDIDYTFFNVNTPEDLDRARRLRKRLGLPGGE